MRIVGCVLIILISAPSFSQSWPEALILSPERSRFEKTSTHAEVISFLTAIQELSDDVRVFSMGKSPEGKDIPVAILAHPAIDNAQQAKTSGKLIIYIQGHIHAGEVEGKEAIMMMMRDILLGSKRYLLNNVIILFAPIYNTDSNDKMAFGRRPSQENSPPEVGIRENSQGFDLNRDGMKMEASETKALFESVLLPWDPGVFVDLHTTNGTWHAWDLTWAPSYHSSGNVSTYNYTVEMLKSITTEVKKKYDLNLGPYGDYDLQEGWPPKNFYTYNHHPRYLVNQFGLRNRIAILSEAFSHEPFYQRVFSTYSFVNEILTYGNDHADEISSLLKRTEEQTIKQLATVDTLQKGVRFKMVPLETLTDFLTYDYLIQPNGEGKKKYLRTGNVSHYQDVTYFAKFEPEIKRGVPTAYLIPSSFKNVAETLKRHGIIVKTLVKSDVYEGEEFQVKGLERSNQLFEGHNIAHVKGNFIKKKKKFSAGDFLVELSQPLGNLAFYLLEPESDDGLLTWNFFDEFLEREGISNKPVPYPVFKFYKIEK